MAEIIVVHLFNCRHLGKGKAIQFLVEIIFLLIGEIFHFGYLSHMVLEFGAIGLSL